MVTCQDVILLSGRGDGDRSGNSGFGQNLSRRRFLRGAALGIGTLFASGLPVVRGGRVGATVQPDVLHRRVRAELGAFTGWLRTNGVQGYIGEVGWPDDYTDDAARWSALAEAWYADADVARCMGHAVSYGRVVGQELQARSL